MFELLQQRVDAVASAFFRAAVPPQEVAARLQTAGCRIEHIGQGDGRTVRLGHADWGECDIVAVRDVGFPMTR